ncbi:tetratricopeptide repeat protein [Nocardia grenadensis]|uniref:tetratricopeptide repeat protein n=1 Tax=Nocardia grenadensis TaxID=931537 RepID=UPI0007A39D9D|nr:tetratricopeptide repeat protein [Nocardia grenadensis]
MSAEEPPGLELLYEGAAAYQRGDIAEALRIFEHAVDTTTDGVHTSALINAASMYDELGDHHRAAVRYRAALARIPADAREKRASTLINYSQALQHLGSLDEAQAVLEQARDLLTDATDLGVLRVSCLLSLSAVAAHRSQWSRVIETATESLDTALRFAPHLAGHPLMNLAGAYFETGRRELGVDFAQQALAAFTAAGDHNAVADTQQNLAQLFGRLDRLDEAEELVLASQAYYERAGLRYRAGVGWKIRGFLAECRGEVDRADEWYRRGLDCFQDSGAVLDAASVQCRLATVAYARGLVGHGQRLLDAAFTVYAERGLGLQCAQLDYWHAVLVQMVVDDMDSPPAELLALGRALAVPAAITIDAVRYTLPDGSQREQWNREVADPAVRLAFRFAYLCGDARLLTDLIETQCAGTTLDTTSGERVERPQFPLDDPVPPTAGESGSGPLHLGAALARVAAAAGLPVAPPARLAVGPDARIALGDYIAAAEQRYGQRVREDRVIAV